MPVPRNVAAVLLLESRYFVGNLVRTVKRQGPGANPQHVVRRTTARSDGIHIVPIGNGPL